MSIRTRLCTIIVLCFCAAAAPGFKAPAAEDKACKDDTAWRQAARTVMQHTQRAREDAARTQDLIRQERKRLKEQITSLQARANRLRTLFNSRKQRFEKLLEHERELAQHLENEREEIKIIQTTVKTATKDLNSQLAEGFMAAEPNGPGSEIRALAESDRFPGMNGIRTLAGSLLETIQRSGSITVRKGTFTATSGSTVEGEILRAGMLTACYRNPDGTAGYLRAGPGGGLVAVRGDLPRGVGTRIGRYMSGGSESLFLDLSHGAVFQQFASEKPFIERLRSGGVLVWPILLVGFVALCLVVERLFFLGRIRSNTDAIMEKVTEMGSGCSWQECRRFCEKRPHIPVCRVMLSALQHLGTSRDVIEDALQEALLKELPQLERFVPTLSVLAAIAPLLGLLGTVTGMISTFQVITLFGTGDPRMMSGGISEALVTTQLGLAVAIPIMFMHHILERRVDAIIGDMEEKGTAFAVTLAANETVEPASA